MNQVENFMEEGKEEALNRIVKVNKKRESLKKKRMMLNNIKDEIWEIEVEVEQLLDEISFRYILKYLEESE